MTTTFSTGSNNRYVDCKVFRKIDCGHGGYRQNKKKNLFMTLSKKVAYN